MFTPKEYYNIIDEKYQNELLDLVTSVEFPWHFLEDTTDEKLKSSVYGTTPAFVNLIYHQNNEYNPYADKFIPLVNAVVQAADINLFSIIRIRLGFLLNTKYSHIGSPYKHNTPHVDGDIDHWTAIYYLNQCDGDTVIFRETEPSEKHYPLHKSTPEKGKVLLFDGRHFHASTCPKVFNKRIVCTINFTGELKN